MSHIVLTVWWRIDKATRCRKRSFQFTCLMIMLSLKIIWTARRNIVLKLLIICLKFSLHFDVVITVTPDNFKLNKLPPKLPSIHMRKIKKVAQVVFKARTRYLINFITLITRFYYKIVRLNYKTISTSTS